jgi:hypothetical protein
MVASVRSASSSAMRSAPRSAAAPLEIRARAREIDQDAPHQLRRHREEMRAILPPHLARINQPQIGLVDQRRGLQRVARLLAVHVVSGQSAQLFINQRHELLQRQLIASAPGQQQMSDFLDRRLRHNRPRHEPATAPPRQTPPEGVNLSHRRSTLYSAPVFAKTAVSSLTPKIFPGRGRFGDRITSL